MKGSYIINEHTMCLIMRKHNKTNQVYTIVMEQGQTFYVLKTLEDIVRCSFKYYEQELSPYLSLLKEVYGKQRLPIVVSYNDNLIFIKSKVSSLNSDVILLSNAWIKEVRALESKTQIKFKNGKYKTVNQKINVIVKQQQLAYSILGVLGDAKRKGI